MGNNISLEENENRGEDIHSSDVEIKLVSSAESGENSNIDVQPTNTKKSKRASSDAFKKRRSTSKNGNTTVLKKTRNNRRR
jgi:hypothetical protein